MVVGYPIPLAPYRQWRGDPLTMELPLVTASGTPVDLAGYGTSWTALLRTSVLATTFIAFTVDTSKVSDPDDPRLILTLDGNQTAGMLEALYGFDVRASGGAVSPFTVWTGSLVMDGDYSRG